MNQQTLAALDAVSRAAEQLCAVEPRTFKMLQAKVKSLERQLLSQSFSSANAQQMLESLTQMMRRLEKAAILKEVPEQWQELTDNVQKLQKHVSLTATLGAKQKGSTLPANLANSLLQSQSSQIKPNLNLPATMKASVANIQYQPAIQSPSISWRDSKFATTQQAPLSDIATFQKSVSQQPFKPQQSMQPEIPQGLYQTPQLQVQQSQIQYQFQQPPQLIPNQAPQINPLQPSDLSVNQPPTQPQSQIIKQFGGNFQQPVNTELYELKAKLQFNIEDIENQLNQQTTAIQDAFTAELTKINASIDDIESQLYKLKQDNEETMTTTFDALREKIQILEENFRENKEIMEQTKKKQTDLLGLGPEIDIILDQLCAIQDKADEYKEMLDLDAIKSYDQQLQLKLQQLEKRAEEILK